MTDGKRSLILGVAGAWLLCAGPAFAQDNTIGNPQLRDFQLRPREQAPAPQRQGPQDPSNPQPRAQQPQPVPQRPVQVAPPPPVTSNQPTTQEPTPTRSQPSAPVQTRPAAPGQPTPAQTGLAPTQVAPQPTGQQPPAAAPVGTPPLEPAPEADTPTAETPPAPESSDLPLWLYGLPALLLVLGGLFLWRRRRARFAEIAEAAETATVEVAPAPAPVVAAPRPDPSPRPWLEIELESTRATFTATETVVSFELKLANVGGAAARNLKIDVKMFNAGAEQDQQIGAFFRTAGRETTRLVLPGIANGQDGVIEGEVGMPLEEMKAVKLDGRMLFIPVVAVNILYEWGDDRSGQTAKSYVIGRELETPSEKMGAFRVDQGPRVWRTVGQRQHKLARRV